VFSGADLFESKVTVQDHLLNPANFGAPMPKYVGHAALIDD
jgi:hypothetical protein